MNDKLENLISAGKKMNLDKSEKDVLDNAVESYIKANPIAHVPTSIPMPFVVGLVILTGLMTLFLVQDQENLISDIPRINVHKIEETATTGPKIIPTAEATTTPPDKPKQKIPGTQEP
ncbi:MAG: hypothetical protein AAB590_01460 [Patescibacteria group bacterium]